MLGELAALGAALMWAISGLVIKPISASYRPFSINSIRSSTALVVLLAILLPQGKMTGFSAIPGHSAVYIIGSGIISLVIGSSLNIASLRHVDISIAYPISTGSWLLFAAFVAAFFFNEPITHFTILGATLVVFGITLLATHSRSSQKSGMKDGEAKGIIFALLAGLAWAIGAAVLKVGLYTVDPLVANIIRLPVVALILGVLVLQRQGISDYKRFSRRALLRAGISGICDQAIGGILFFISINLAGLARATILSCTSPLFLAPLSVIFLKEKITWRVALGTLACVGGILLTVL